MGNSRSSNQVTIGLIQMKAGPSPEANLIKAFSKVREAAKRGAQIISLQELFRTLYFPQTEDPTHLVLSETIPGPTTEELSRLARELSVVIIVPIFERRAERICHNTAVTIDADGEIAGIYRKMHIPNDALFYEKFYFTPGDLGFEAHQTKYGKVGVLICWDQWFPEAARLAALSGPQILFYPTAIGWHSKEKKEERLRQKTAWEIIQRAHAVANGIYVAVANRVGREGELTFWGSSFVAGPFGEMLARAGETQEEILIAKCDFSKIDKVRSEWPFLRDRRIDAYEPIVSRFLSPTA